MMAKLTIKQEKFAQAYIETGNASEAYRAAYPRSLKWKPESVEVNASKMLVNTKVLPRIEQLQAEHRERHDVTIDNLTRELNEDRKLARETGKASAAIAAVMGKAKIHGLLPDRHNVNVTTETELVSLDDATDAQLIAAMLEFKTRDELLEFCRLDAP